MPSERRHTEFFGPDWNRIPVLSGAPEVAAVQIAAGLAQLRAPLLRGQTDVENHAAFIRSLADKLFPDVASNVTMSVGGEVANQIVTQLIDNSGTYSLLHCWLADSVGGGETALAPDAVAWDSNTIVLETVTAKKRFLVITPTTSVSSVTVDYTGDRTWYWAAARQGRVVYSNALDFDV